MYHEHNFDGDVDEGIDKWQQVKDLENIIVNCGCLLGIEEDEGDGEEIKENDCLNDVREMVSVWF